MCGGGGVFGKKNFQDSLSLKVGQRSPETAVRIYHYTLRVIAEERRSYECVCCLKPNIIFDFLRLKL